MNFVINCIERGERRGSVNGTENYEFPTLAGTPRYYPDLHPSTFLVSKLLCSPLANANQATASYKLIFKR